MAHIVFGGAAALALLLGSASFQAKAQQPNPADPSAAVPVTEYQSAFTGYRKPQFEQKLDWRQANDTVRDVGGHAGALKDQPPGKYESAPGTAVSAPGASHQGHGQ